MFSMLAAVDWQGTNLLKQHGSNMGTSNGKQKVK
jgi:hypothetical protein